MYGMYQDQSNFPIFQPMMLRCFLQQLDVVVTQRDAQIRLITVRLFAVKLDN
jgi:hypothetical protein